VLPLLSGFLPRLGSHSTRLARCQAWSLSEAIDAVLEAKLRAKLHNVTPLSVEEA
jgi:hypothetical protein